MWNVKKEYNVLLCRIDTDAQTLKNFWFSKETGVGGQKDGLGVWDVNPVKSGCEYCCTTINVIKFIQLKNALS